MPHDGLLLQKQYGVTSLDPVDRGLVGEWRFDRNSGRFLPDYSGYANHGAISSDGTWVGTPVGPGVVLVPGSFGNINLGASTILHPAHMSVEVLWFQRTAVNAWSILTLAGAIDTATNDGFGLQIQRQLGDAGAPRILWSLGDGASFTNKNGNHDLTVGQTWHAVGTYDGAATNVYVNGRWVAGGAYSNAIAYDGVAGSWIGTTDNTSGICDQPICLVRFYDRALSAAETMRRYDICLSRASGAPSVWMPPWSFPYVAGGAPPVGNPWYSYAQM